MSSLSHLSLTALLALLPCASAFSRSNDGAEKPNILYIIADDLGYGDVQRLNPQRGLIPTPNLDRLAAEGKIFTDAHSGSAVCTPTRYGILTGRHSWRTRLQKGVLGGENAESLIAANRLTVAGFLREQGYHTACIGKWHLGFHLEKPSDRPADKDPLPIGTRITDGPITRGFDSFLGCSNARTISSLILNDRVVEIITPESMLPRLESATIQYLADQAAAAKSGKPFFLYLALTSPHTPIVPTAEWKGRSGLGDYGDFVMQTDHTLGAILDALEREGLASNTLVVFTSDNGCSPQAGTRELEKRGHFASGHFRGYKSDIWDGGHRVPFLIRWPGKIEPGTESADLVCLTDFFATCAEILGVPLPANAGEDSTSILPLLLDRVLPSQRPPVVHHSLEGMFAIRDGKWKCIFGPGSGGWSPGGDADPIQLYDMSEDPGETRNLASTHPEIVRQLTLALQKQIDQGRSTPGAPTRNDVPVKFSAPRATNQNP